MHLIPVVRVKEHETKCHCCARSGDIDVHTFAFFDLITGRLVALATRTHLRNRQLAFYSVETVWTCSPFNTR